MINEINEWIKNFCKKIGIIKQNTVNMLSVFPVSKTISRNNNTKTKMYLNDPVTPEFIIEEEIVQPRLQVNATGDCGGGYPLGSIQQQASACKGMIANALNYLISKTPKSINRWAATNILTISPRAGKDINAFYDRTGLKFFFFGDKNTQTNIYACDSRSVVTHELGHAYLDILRPDFWSCQSSEVWAFHEAFGDMTALLESLQFDVLIQNAIDETNGDLSKSNILTRLAAQMGIGLYHIANGENEGLSNCLRDISISYNYIEPEKLPDNGPDNKIINECHSFSRIFSGAFYEIFVKIANNLVVKGQDQITAIKNSRDILAKYLMYSVLAVPLTTRLFDAMAKQFLYFDKNNGGEYQDIISNVFISRNILNQTVKMLDIIDIKEVKRKIKGQFEIQIHGNTKTIRTLAKKHVKLRELMPAVTIQSVNPLFDLEIDIPNQTAYYFDENDQLTDMIQAQDTEIIDSAYKCLDFLNKFNLVGEHETALFLAIDGKLVRKQMICKCGSPNYCDPNAPEYGKPWKPKNNSGCLSCSKGNCEPQSCDCIGPTPVTPPKLGCYTTVKNGSSTSYKVGQFISRKVC